MVIVIIKSFIEILVFNANSVDPYQHSAASDLNLHCLPLFLLLDARHKWVNKTESPVFVLLCFLYFQKNPFRFLLLISKCIIDYHFHYVEKKNNKTLRSDSNIIYLLKYRQTEAQFLRDVENIVVCIGKNSLVRLFC